MMKKLFLLTLLVAGVMMGVEAQNRSIDFEQTKEWKKVLKKAKKEKKLIFVDCYTSWCGPCKMLAKDVFTRDEVADYFNANFVCAKYDMEKDADGVILGESISYLGICRPGHPTGGAPDGRGRIGRLADCRSQAGQRSAE